MLKQYDWFQDYPFTLKFSSVNLDKGDIEEECKGDRQKKWKGRVFYFTEISETIVTCLSLIKSNCQLLHDFKLPKEKYTFFHDNKT